MIKVDNLSKSFGKHEVLKNISTQIEEGEVVAVIGFRLGQINVSALLKSAGNPERRNDCH